MSSINKNDNNDLDIAQAHKLFSTLEADPKLQAKWHALLGIKSPETEHPAPSDTRSAEDTAPPPGKGKKLDDVSEEKKMVTEKTAEAEQSSDFLSVMHDYALIRRVKQPSNFFVPNAIGMMTVLNMMDKILIRKFRARRAAMMMFPPLHVMYYSILWSLQTARCLDYAGYLENTLDSIFLSRFLDLYPPETMPIAGPLLPFFKAVTTFRHENGLYRRISPSFPISSLRSLDHDAVRSQTSSVFFPNVPVITDVVGRMISSAQAATDPRKFKGWPAPFPFEYEDAADPTQGYKNDVNLGGHKFSKDPSTWNAAEQAALITPGLAHKWNINPDVADNSSLYLDDLKNPNATTATYPVVDLQTWMRMTKLTWFANLLPAMAEHANLTIGHGTLADCSLDGPSAGAYVYKYKDSDEAPKFPRFPFDPLSLQEMSGSVFTTISTPSAVDERLGAMTQVHGNLASNHPLHDQLPNPHGRSGNVWDIRPIYGPSVEVSTLSTIQIALEKFLDPKIRM